MLKSANNVRVPRVFRQYQIQFWKFHRWCRGLNWPRYVELHTDVTWHHTALRLYWNMYMVFFSVAIHVYHQLLGDPCNPFVHSFLLCYTGSGFLFLLIWRQCTLQWHHNGRDSVSNHQPHDCLLNRLFRRTSKKTSKLRVTGLCAGTGEFPAQMVSNAENVSIWWRHHEYAAVVGQRVCEMHYQPSHDNVIKSKHFPRFWPFVRGYHRLMVDSRHKSQWRGALVFCLICTWTNRWANNGDTGDLRRHRAHYGITVMH